MPHLLWWLACCPWNTSHEIWSHFHRSHTADQSEKQEVKWTFHREEKKNKIIKTPHKSPYLKSSPTSVKSKREEDSCLISFLGSAVYVQQCGSGRIGRRHNFSDVSHYRHHTLSRAHCKDKENVRTERIVHHFTHHFIPRPVLDQAHRNQLLDRQTKYTCFLMPASQIWGKSITAITLPKSSVVWKRQRLAEDCSISRVLAFLARSSKVP